MKGKLIVIEGTDCSGKETQTKLLLEKLKNTYYFSYPNYDSPTGKIVGGPYLGKEEISACWFPEGATKVDPYVCSLYYAADRKYNIEKVITLLEQGNNVILDRYVYSNMAHQGAKEEILEKREEIYHFLDELEFNLLKLPQPEIRVFLHMPTEYSKILKKNRTTIDEHEKDENHLKQAELAYIEIAKLYDFKTIECVQNNEIRSIESINQELVEYIKGRMNKVEEEKIKSINGVF